MANEHGTDKPTFSSLVPEEPVIKHPVVTATKPVVGIADILQVGETGAVPGSSSREQASTEHASIDNLPSIATEEERAQRRETLDRLEQKLGGLRERTEEISKREKSLRLVYPDMPFGDRWQLAIDETGHELLDESAQAAIDKKHMEERAAVLRMLAKRYEKREGLTPQQSVALVQKMVTEQATRRASRFLRKGIASPEQIAAARVEVLDDYLKIYRAELRHAAEKSKSAEAPSATEVQNDAVADTTPHIQNADNDTAFEHTIQSVTTAEPQVEIVTPQTQTVVEATGENPQIQAEIQQIRNTVRGVSINGKFPDGATIIHQVDGVDTPLTIQVPNGGARDYTHGGYGDTSETNMWSSPSSALTRLTREVGVDRANFPESLRGDVQFLFIEENPTFPDQAVVVYEFQQSGVDAFGRVLRTVDIAAALPRSQGDALVTLLKEHPDAIEQWYKSLAQGLEDEGRVKRIRSDRLVVIDWRGIPPAERAILSSMNPYEFKGILRAWEQQGKITASEYKDPASHGSIDHAGAQTRVPVIPNKHPLDGKPIDDEARQRGEDLYQYVLRKKREEDAKKAQQQVPANQPKKGRGPFGWW